MENQTDPICSRHLAVTGFYLQTKIGANMSPQNIIKNKAE
jgi:hypothetical protein